MTLEEAKIHIQYIKTQKPEVFKELGMDESVTDEMIDEAATIATQAHWGTPDISVESLFNKTLKNLIKEK